MSLEEVTVLNDVAVYYLCRNRSAEAMQLLECAWVNFISCERQSSVFQSPQDGKDRALTVQSSRLISPSRNESPQVEEESPTLSGCPRHDSFPTRDCYTISDLTSQSVVPIDFFVQRTQMNDSSGNLVRISDEMYHTASRGCTFSIYMRAFLLENNDCEMDLSGLPRGMSRIPAVILYNIGLVFHRLGTESESSSFFHKAVELYRLSLTFLENNKDECVYFPKFKRLVLALMNNLGCCHSHFNDMKDVSLYRQRIGEELRLSTNMLHLTCEECIFFHRVALLNGRPAPTLAPAA